MIAFYKSILLVCSVFTFRHKLMDSFTRAVGVQPGIEPAIKLPNWCQEL
jgi:hypothetical protein